MEKLPDLEIAWIKGKGEIDFARPNVYFALGSRGSGKSSFLEMCATKCLEAGGQILDCYGSKDSEGLAFLRSNYVTSGNKKAILFRGDAVEITSHESIAASEFKLSDLGRADIFISAAAAYSDMNDEYMSVNKILETLWNRHYWTKPVFLILREAANLIFSRLKIRKEQSIAKAEAVAMLKESRHSGTGVGLDSIKATSVDVDLRVLSDFLIYKNTGLYSLPRDSWWIYKTFSPAAMRNLRPSEFIIVDRHGNLGLGRFSMPPFHKRTEENILTEVGLQVVYHKGAAGVDQLQAVILEGLVACGDGADPTQVSEWIKANRGLTINPISIGKRARGLGYRIDVGFEGGKVKRSIIKNPA